VRVLVTGAKGQLGVDLLDVLGHSHDAVGLDLPEFDITKPDAARVIAAIHPAWVVHAAAWTDVDGCERDPALANLVNGEGTRRVAEGCRDVGAGLLYLSTDYVFDGRRALPISRRTRQPHCRPTGDQSWPEGSRAGHRAPLGDRPDGMALRKVR